MKIDFEKAIEIAKENATKLLPDAKDFSLEEIILDSHDNFEISLSYALESKELKVKDTESAGLGSLLKILSNQRIKKVFIVNKNGDFKGFRNIKMS